MSNLGALQETLGHTFRDESLLRLALTHPSVAHEATGHLPHNQRLEFLGDSVLGLVLTRELYEKFPDFGEGPLTKARAQMVNRRTLAAEARRLGLGEHLIVSRGEDVRPVPFLELQNLPRVDASRGIICRPQRTLYHLTP